MHVSAAGSRELSVPGYHDLGGSSRRVKPLSSLGNVIILLVCLAIGSGVAAAFVCSRGVTPASSAEWAAVLLCFAPLVALTLATGLPSYKESMSAYLLYDYGPAAIMLVGVGGWSILTITAHVTNANDAGAKDADTAVDATANQPAWDPYSATLLFVIGLATMGLTRECNETINSHGITWGDLTVVLSLYLWPTHYLAPLAYPWLACFVAMLLSVSFTCVRAMPGCEYRLVPTLNDLWVGLCTVVVAGVVTVPIGLWLGYFEWTGHQVKPGEFMCFVVEVLFTNSFVEEMVFRAVLFNGLKNRTRRPGLSLILSTAAFAVVHWSRETELERQVASVLIALLGGTCYAVAYLKTDNVLAGWIAHAVLDAGWGRLLRAT